MTKTAALVLGLIMLGMFGYGVIVNLTDLRAGEKHVSMKGSGPLHLNRRTNPTAFWIYFALSVAGTAACAVFAIHFLSGLI